MSSLASSSTSYFSQHIHLHHFYSQHWRDKHNISLILWYQRFPVTQAADMTCLRSSTKLSYETLAGKSQCDNSNTLVVEDSTIWPSCNASLIFTEIKKIMMTTIRMIMTTPMMMIRMMMMTPMMMIRMMTMLVLAGRRPIQSCLLSLQHSKPWLAYCADIEYCSILWLSFNTL